MGGTILRRNGGFSLSEVMVAIAITVVVMFTALASWEMSWRETSKAATASKVSKEAFGVLQQIEQEINRGQTIAIPDPDYTTVPSIQISVPTASGLKRRAFRMVNGALIKDLKDEGGAPLAVFDHVTTLTFQMLDAPTNSIVQIDCTCTFNGRAFAARTVAYRRN